MNPILLAAALPGPLQAVANLLNDALTWILILVVPIAAAKFGYHSLMRTWSEGDSGKVESHNKAMKGTIVGGAIALSASAIVKLVLGYFGS